MDTNNSNQRSQAQLGSQLPGDPAPLWVSRYGSYPSNFSPGTAGAYASLGWQTQPRSFPNALSGPPPLPMGYFPGHYMPQPPPSPGGTSGVPGFPNGFGQYGRQVTYPSLGITLPLDQYGRLIGNLPNVYHPACMVPRGGGVPSGGFPPPPPYSLHDNAYHTPPEYEVEDEEEEDDDDDEDDGSEEEDEYDNEGEGDAEDDEEESGGYYAIHDGEEHYFVEHESESSMSNEPEPSPEDAPAEEEAEGQGQSGEGEEHTRVLYMSDRRLERATAESLGLREVIMHVSIQAHPVDD